MSIDILKSKIGSEKILTDIEDKVTYGYDASRKKYMPDYVVIAESITDIVETLKFANEHNIKVYPRGAGTGQTGGALPMEGGIVLVLAKMNKIIEIDRDNLTATVEPGVIVGKLNEELGNFGLMYPPDPASAKAATIGGTIAECAGGLRGLKYGVTRDYVLKLEVVTIDGDILQFGARTIKSVSGYDIVRLLVGSEGTFAVITKIIIKLLPKPAFIKTILVTFSKELEALNAAAGVVKYPLIPATLEFMDSKAIKACNQYNKKEVIKDANGALLVEFDGEKELVERDFEALKKVCAENNSKEITVSQSLEQREELWNFRRSISPALFLIAPIKVNEDICVPRSELKSTYLKIKELADNYKLNFIGFGHAGDGNMHVSFMYDNQIQGETEKVEKAIGEVFKIVIDAGGTLTAEHGIGITKSKYLPLEFGEKEIEIMKKIKTVWDPKNLLNPNKIFP